MLFGGLVGISAKMQNAVDHYAVEFGNEGRFVLLGILAHAVDADKNVAGNAGRLGVREGYNIGEGIVIQVFNVHTVKIVVRTEYEIELG